MTGLQVPRKNFITKGGEIIKDYASTFNVSKAFIITDDEHNGILYYYGNYDDCLNAIIESNKNYMLKDKETYTNGMIEKMIDFYTNVAIWIPVTPID